MILIRFSTNCRYASGQFIGHLEGYDPTQAPTFVWPERLQTARAEIHRQARLRDQVANDPSSSDR